VSIAPITDESNPTYGIYSSGTFLQLNERSVYAILLVNKSLNDIGCDG
jgi:hypothetical protein